MVDYKKLSAEYSQRFGYAMSVAANSDYFSLDGKTWDPSADWTIDANHIFKSEDFMALIYSEIKAIMDPANKKPPTLDEVSPQLREWLFRVEARN